MATTLAKLETDPEWDALAAILDPKAKIPAVQKVLVTIRGLGAIAALVEENYLDQDFSAEFSAFYSKVFRRYTKICRRIHFFSEALGQIVNPGNGPTLISDQLSDLSKTGQYIGFIVVRPVDHAPLGRVVLRSSPQSPMNMKSEVLIRAKHEVHVLGATLCVEGNTLTQQDSRVAACAQASIWMAGRHFHIKHKGPWVSTVEINDAATKVTDHGLSQSLPAGSSGLSVDNVVRALKDMGRQPLLYAGTVAGQQQPLYQATPQWPPKLSPASIIHRYVDSGIPVILGFLPWAANIPIGHAVVATGLTREKLAQAPTVAHPAKPTRADYCSYFLVNDDQRGTNLRVGITAGMAHAEAPYSLDNLIYIILPLPSKVYIPAEHAESVAWDNLRAYVADWNGLKAKFAGALGASEALGDAFTTACSVNRVVARTYLTYGWRYKQRMLQNTCSDTVKVSIVNHDLPKHVWVTEFGTFDSLNHLDDNSARIYAHAVIDATSSNYWEGRCLFHAPGYLSKWHHNDKDPHGPYQQTMVKCPDDVPYGVKIRGTP